MDIKLELGFRIKSLREEKGLSQRELSISADLDRSYIASVESGKRNVSIVNVAKIAAALHVSLSELFNAEPFK